MALLNMIFDFRLAMEEIGEFFLERHIVEQTKEIKRKVKLVFKKEIMWPLTGKAPRDSPVCGFSNELCPPPKSQAASKGINKYP